MEHFGSYLNHGYFPFFQEVPDLYHLRLEEVGGKNKTTEQIQGVKNSFVAADDIEYGNPKRIPLWLFGFLY